MSVAHQSDNQIHAVFEFTGCVTRPLELVNRKINLSKSAFFGRWSTILYQLPRRFPTKLALETNHWAVLSDYCPLNNGMTTSPMGQTMIWDICVVSDQMADRLTIGWRMVITSAKMSLDQPV
jgi:hypothetical protein